MLLFKALREIRDIQMKLKVSRKKLTQIVTEELKEGGMPSSIIRDKVEWSYKSNEEILQYVEDRLSNESDLRWYGQSEEFVEKKLREMAWRHGYGKMNPKYWRRYLDAKQNKSQVEQVIKEETEKYLKEEAYDCVKDYKLGGMSWEEYCACLEHYGEQC